MESHSWFRLKSVVGLRLTDQQEVKYFKPKCSLTLPGGCAQGFFVFLCFFVVGGVVGIQYFSRLFLYCWVQCRPPATCQPNYVFFYVFQFAYNPGKISSITLFIRWSFSLPPLFNWKDIHRKTIYSKWKWLVHQLRYAKGGFLSWPWHSEVCSPIGVFCCVPLFAEGFCWKFATLFI